VLLKFSSWTRTDACASEQSLKLNCGKISTGFQFQIGPNGLVFATRVSDGYIGTVCDDGMTDTTAQGICSTMNLVPQVKVNWWTLPNFRADPVILESVSCPATVTDFKEQCDYRLESDCSNLEAVAIDCNSTQDHNAQFECPLRS
jgi:hypothetical protein